MNQLSKLHRLTTPQRRQVIFETYPDIPQFEKLSLSETIGETLVENYLGNYPLPMGLLGQIKVDKKTYIVPMVTEEPSVIAAANKGAKLLIEFKTTADPKELIGQVVLSDLISISESRNKLESNIDSFLELAVEHSQRMVARGGGPKRMWVEEKGEFLTLYLGFDPCDAMGANTINYVLEALGDKLEQEIGGTAFLKILSNYQVDSKVTSRAYISFDKLGSTKEEGEKVALKIVQASRYAEIDPYRAVTHNKGIMNGIDSVVVATGNDWRAVNANIHAYAGRKGHYLPLSKWSIEEGNLLGQIELPLNLATVGGTISSHPLAKWSLALLGNPDSHELARIIASVGLAQNFAALLALVTEGIQKGHMSLHANQLAMQLNVVPEDRPAFLKALKAEKAISESVARKILKELRTNHEKNDEIKEL